MTNPAITARTAALALGAFLLLHQPARAGMVSVLEAHTSGESIWVYTGGTIVQPTISARSRAPSAGRQPGLGAD